MLSDLRRTIILPKTHNSIIKKTKPENSQTWSFSPTLIRADYG
jgi:hypothetical protein